MKHAQIFVFLLSFIAAACMGACTGVTTPPEPTFEVPILNSAPEEYITPTPISDDARAWVKDELSWVLEGNKPFVEQPVGGETVSYYQLSGLSTGELRTIDLAGYTLDVLDVYVMMIPGPVSVPLVIGFSNGESYVNLVLGRHHLDREELLAEVPRSYPRWQLLRIMLFGDFVTSTGPDWSQCTGEFPALQLRVNEAYCEVGKTLAEAFPAEEQLLRIQALGNVPIGFALPWFLMPPPE